VVRVPAARALGFARVQISYTLAGGGAPITAGWDAKTNTSA
jgi:hypothetical protein